MGNGETTLHQVDTRVAILEKIAQDSKENFAQINKKLDGIHSDVVKDKVERAEEKGRAGWKGALAGAASGGSIFGIAKFVSRLGGK